MNGIKFSQNIVVKNINKKGVGILYLEYRLNTERGRINLNEKIEVIHWDSIKHQVKSSHTNVKDLNLLLNNALSTAIDIVVRARLDKKGLSISQFQLEFYNENSRGSFTQFAYEQLEQRKPTLAPGTYRHHKSVLKILSLYKEDVLFSELSYDFLHRFDAWLVNNRRNIKNSRNKKFITLKVYVSLALRSGIKLENPFRDFKISTVKTKITYLEKAELKRTIEYFFSDSIKSAHKNVLQYYLFSCFTGLRISDVKAITRKNIEGDILRVVVYKTKNSTQRELQIPLGASALSVLNESGALFEKIISDQKTNDCLKEIAKVLRIPKSLSFHSSRHTFGSLMVQSGVGPAQLQKLMGHANIKQTMVYVHINLNDLPKEINKLDLLLME